jgi:hypothetical protein
MTQFTPPASDVQPPAGGKEEVRGGEAKPPTLAVRPDGIPAALHERRQWVCWCWERRRDGKGKGKWTKLPINPLTGGKAQANNPATWCSFEEALAYHRAHPDTTDGIGYVFAADDPFAGVDLDDALDPETGALHPWAAELVALLDSYTEVSPSGTGVKVYVRAKWLGDKHRRPYGTGEVEVYDRTRFFCLTGHTLPGTPAGVEERQQQLERLYAKVFAGPQKRPPADTAPDAGAEPAGESPLPRNPGNGPSLSDDQLLRKARGADNGPNFEALYDRGDTGGHGGDASRADSALCFHLAWWTKDRGQIDRLFRQSALMRPKWDERHSGDGRTYGEMTVDRALEHVSGGYTPGRAGPSTNGKAQGPLAPAGAAKAAKEFTLGPLTLRPGPPHRTPTRLHVPLAVLRDGCQVDSITLGKSANGRKEAARLLAPLLGGGPGAGEIERVFSAIIVAAEGALNNQPPPSGPRARDIVRALVPQALQFRFRTEQGLWSESLRCEMRRQDFVNFHPDSLLEAAAKAVDVPRIAPGAEPPRGALLEAVVCELKILWPDILAATPWPAAAGLSPETAEAAAQKFREALVRIWNAPRVHERVKNKEDGDIMVFDASLISRVKDLSRDSAKIYEENKGHPPWTMIHRPFRAWWRPGEGAGGEIVPRLGMRFELGLQMSVALPGVSNQPSLNTIGEAFGLLDPDPKGVPRVTSGGKQRLAVLALDLSQDMLDDPASENPVTFE